MEEKLEKAINLRNEGKYKESNQLLLNLVDTHPENPLINYHCAWSFDVMGNEIEAVPYYEKAISNGLNGDDLEGAIIGLGSTYRTLGEYEKSNKTFLKGIESFPNNQAMKVFHAMTLYNLNKHNRAMEILLKSIAEKSDDSSIKSYKKAINFYSDKLDEKWK
ncbi:tetratricopeptide (TPR) repeat protein [Bacillus pakistanensis]|uniref:Tetratricopeptide (TPR) repeat protein n=1 Tax=Rossellomorea pakistanensis TaxID=992288 RepID=A0ABS2N721_9BACI|nr:tetratricopeptide repeat protein [Bacillus pakistanensis]MBM7583653.1 tetratricopeptide (TPR) repeat protein [Bacillus pakistanensis]